MKLPLHLKNYLGFPTVVGESLLDFSVGFLRRHWEVARVKWISLPSSCKWSWSLNCEDAASFLLLYPHSQVFHRYTNPQIHKSCVLIVMVSSAASPRIVMNGVSRGIFLSSAVMIEKRKLEVVQLTWKMPNSPTEKKAVEYPVNNNVNIFETVY